MNNVKHVFIWQDKILISERRMSLVKFLHSFNWQWITLLRVMGTSMSHNASYLVTHSKSIFSGHLIPLDRPCSWLYNVHYLYFLSHSYFYTAYDDINCWEWMCVNCDDNLYSKFDISPSKMNTESKTTDRPRPTESPRWADWPTPTDLPSCLSTDRMIDRSTALQTDCPTDQPTDRPDWLIGKSNIHDIIHDISFN